MPLFSIIIPTCNRASFIRTTLESVHAQEYKDYEVIVVDDGSTDGTLDFLRDYPWVRTLQQQNMGPGVARNYGVSQSSGQYIAFLDSDDIWFPWTLSTFANAIENHGHPELMAGALQLFWRDEELRRVKRKPLKVEVFNDYYETSRKGNFVGAGMMIVRKQAFDAVGGFTEKRVYAEDCDLALRFGQVKGFVQILAPATLGYRQHATNARRNIDLIYKGTMNLVESERAGTYPGGPARRADRVRLVTLHVRPFSLECLYCGDRRRAWRLYLETLTWHLRIFRWKYLFGFPVLALTSTLGAWRDRESPAAGAVPSGKVPGPGS